MNERLVLLYRDDQERIGAETGGLAGHPIHDVVDSEAKSERGEIFGVARVVRPLPSVAEMHVEANGDHDAPFVVADGAPAGNEAVLLVSPSGVDILLDGNLKLLQVVDDVEERIVVATLDGPVGEDLRIPLRKLAQSACRGNRQPSRIRP